MNARPIQVRRQPLADGRLPAVCAPLVAPSLRQLMSEASAVGDLGPDLLEWRVDFFEAIADTDAVLEAASGLRQAAPGIPILFTRRSIREGGQPIPLDEDGVVALYRAVCAGGDVDLVDFEMGNDPDHVGAVRAASWEHDIGLVLSYHNFQQTPDLSEILDRFEAGQRLGADVSKVAVMPRSTEDVLRLMEATVRASASLSIPVISMSMGSLGAVTRLCGGLFGSALTFAVGERASAPGQIPLAEVREVLGVLRRAAEAG